MERSDKNSIENNLYELSDIAPFMDKDHLNALAKMAIEKGGINAISPISPFLDREMLNEYLNKKYL